MKYSYTSSLDKPFSKRYVLHARVANEVVDHFMEDTLICSVWKVTVLFVQEILKLFYNSPFLLVFVHTCSLHGRVSHSWKPRGELFLTHIFPQTSVWPKAPYNYWKYYMFCTWLLNSLVGKASQTGCECWRPLNDTVVSCIYRKHKMHRKTQVTFWGAERQNRLISLHQWHSMLQALQLNQRMRHSN